MPRKIVIIGANTAGVEAVGKITGKTKAAYFPRGLPIKIKVIVEKRTRRLVGGQIVSSEEVTQRINVLSLAIQNHMTLDNLEG